ncbi:MAG: bifunctional phosphoglucose/phosphomannose isomerase [archaeon]
MHNNIILDKSDVKSVLEKYPSMIREAISLGKDVSIPGGIKNIFITGMGGSAFPGDLLKCAIKELNIPIFVNKGYNLPKHADSQSLVFAVSYSGNTEETISSYRDALRKKAIVVAISSGGKLEELSIINKNIHIKVPGGFQPRLSTPYLFVPMVNVLFKAGLIKDYSIVLETTINVLNNGQAAEKARNIASRLKGKIPLIYSSDEFFAVAEKWKCDINENSKVPAFYNVFPEFNHNEICSYLNPIGNFFVIFIKDESDSDRVKKRFAIVKRLITKRGIDVIELSLSGEHVLTRILTGIYIGLWVSYYLALEYHQDPTPVAIIEELKKELEK